MITFLIGLLILALGYIFYSSYVEKQFGISEEPTPAFALQDNVDFMPLPHRKNMLIHLLNIAGMGPILGAIQGILFGPIAFILIPLGCVLMGGVHDYFSGMLSVRNKGAQITTLIKEYLGKGYFRFFILFVSLMLLLLTAVFVFTAGDLISERFLQQSDFSLSNSVVLTVYIAIAVYYILATLFPISEIIGKFYPFFGFLLIFGTLLVLIGFFTNGIQLHELTLDNLNMHPKKLALIPMFFMTVSCGLLSGFHSTQATIISRTVASEKEGKTIFYGMMCLESLIAMIWAAASMHVYSLNLVPQHLIGTANVVNTVANVFVFPALACVVTIAVVVLPITSGDTALRGLRMIIGEALNMPQSLIKNRLIIIIPIAALMTAIVFWAKSAAGSFSVVWRYFNFANQFVTIPTFLYATIYLFKNGKNYWITLLPGLFYIYIITSFLLNSSIGFQIPYKVSSIIAFVVTAISLFCLFKYKLKKEN